MASPAPMLSEDRLLRRIRFLLLFFIVALVLSGITAFPLVWETRLLHEWMGVGTGMERTFPAIAHWIDRVHAGLVDAGLKYPFLAYGTDWLAFAHIMIAVAFIGPLRDPVRNRWVIEFGMIACLLIIPLATIMGPVRGIPWFWRCIDCSFGVLGILPLGLARAYALRLESALAAPAGAGEPAPP